MRLQISLVLITLLIGLFGCNNWSDSVFTDTTYQDSIKQNIGGFLIREIHHYNDFHSWSYDIKYSFKNKLDSIYLIGSGSFYCQEPLKDEQLFKIDKWIILKTCKDRDADVIFVCDSDFKTCTEYIISPETIQKANFWIKQNIDSQPANWDNVAKIKEIDKNGKITVLYTYAKNKRIFSFITGKRLIIYKIDFLSGKLEMKTILDPKQIETKR